MTEQEFFSPTVENFYTKVGKIINDNFSHHLYDDDIIEKIMKELEPKERTEQSESSIRSIISNRQLIVEHFL